MNDSDMYGISSLFSLLFANYCSTYQWEVYKNLNFQMDKILLAS